ncbi:MAG: hypothetical protein GX352_09995 [Clostridiales bacterium]|nr:hypothetical protein [Clostridiales bacterium]
MAGQPYGFVAFWKSSDTWYSISEEERQEFLKEIKEIMDEAAEKGIESSGTFSCSWSSEWKYFTFWLCPNIDLLQETIAKLEKIGDINKFNIQHHYVGRQVEGEVLV